MALPVAPHEGPDRHDQPDDRERDVDLEDGHERSEPSADELGQAEFDRQHAL